MKGKNRYIKKVHITERKFKEILRCFCLDLTAKQTSKVTKVNCNTINRYFNKTRERIMKLCQTDSPFKEEIGVDKSYFGAKRDIISYYSRKISIDIIIYSDKWRGYDELVDIGYDKDFRVKYGNNEFAKSKNHINGIESFWNYAKMWLYKFRGLSKNKFNLHLKEYKFRFNTRHNEFQHL